MMCGIPNILYSIFTFIGGSRREYWSVLNQFKLNMKYLTSYFDGTCSKNIFYSYNASRESMLFARDIAYNGFNTYLIFDNLSNHAKIHRTLMLVLKRSPGREAYPGDAFFIHSSLLERAGRFSYFHNLGSVTSAPVTETQKNIITDYITTNLISITDGSWFLSMNMRIKTLFPPVDLDLSVSRLGDSSQPDVFKKLCKRYKNLVVNYLVFKGNSFSPYFFKCKYSYDLLFYRSYGSSFSSTSSLIYNAISNCSHTICRYRRDSYMLFNITAKFIGYSVLFFYNLTIL